MSFIEYLAAVGRLLQRAEDDGNYEEFLRLLGELEKSIAETRLKVEVVKAKAGQ